MIERIYQLVDTTEAEALTFLQRIVEINSHTFHPVGSNAIQDILMKELRSLGLQCERRQMAEVGDQLIARTRRTAGRDDILMIGHIDTVHLPSSLFREFQVRGDRGYGPGALDMKAGVVQMLFALKILSQLGLLDKLPLVTLFNSDEEIGSRFSRPVIKELCLSASKALVFEFGREGDNIATRRRGAARFRLEIKGKAAHAGAAHHLGVSAIRELADLILKIEAFTNTDQQIVSNVGIVNGGTGVNTVPDFASAEFEFRAASLRDMDVIRAKFQEYASHPVVSGTQVTIEEVSSSPPLEELSGTQALLDSYRVCGKEVGLNFDRIPHVLGGLSDANHTGENGIPTIDCLGPFGEGAHTEQEYVYLPSFKPKLANLVLWLARQV